MCIGWQGVVGNHHLLSNVEKKTSVKGQPCTLTCTVTEKLKETLDFFIRSEANMGLDFLDFFKYETADYLMVQFCFGLLGFAQLLGVSLVEKCVYISEWSQE